jgi:hypothetical protein
MARVSQLSPVLGEGGRPDGEADMRMGCGGKKKGMERKRKLTEMSVGQSGLRSWWR